MPPEVTLENVRDLERYCGGGTVVSGIVKDIWFQALLPSAVMRVHTCDLVRSEQSPVHTVMVPFTLIEAEYGALVLDVRNGSVVSSVVVVREDVVIFDERSMLDSCHCDEEVC
jgi:hypothetical protein